MTCTFFGHRICPESIKTPLRATIVDLIENKGVFDFYVGNQGDFDRQVREILSQLKEIYPQIRYSVVLAYLPQRDKIPENSVFPEEIACVPPRYAISKRNRWLLCRADYVITYVRSVSGGAATFDALAEKAGKKMIRL